MTLVFVHGIFSSCAVFETLKAAITQGVTGSVEFNDFNYAFKESITANAKLLNERLDHVVPEGGEAVIIAHSMGGLVARMALLTGPDTRKYRVRTLIMLATPNHGAIRMSQIRGVAEMVRTVAGKIPVVYSRNQGLDELTRVNTVMNDLIGNNGKAVVRTKSTDYVTIPATMYNGDNPYRLRIPRGFTQAALDVIAFLSAHEKTFKLNYSHDGIVEERSVRMVTHDAEDLNERTFYSSPLGHKAVGRTANLHIVHSDLRQANHVEIHSIPKVCSLVVSLLNAASIDAWMGSLSEEELANLDLTNG